MIKFYSNISQILYKSYKFPRIHTKTLQINGVIVSLILTRKSCELA